MAIRTTLQVVGLPVESTQGTAVAATKIGGNCQECHEPALILEGVLCEKCRQRFNQ